MEHTESKLPLLAMAPDAYTVACIGQMVLVPGSTPAVYICVDIRNGERVWRQVQLKK